MALFGKSKRPLSDDEIIELYWQRNERAIEETDVKYRRYMFTVAYNILNSNEDCEECLNDTYVSVWNAIPPQKPTYLKAFLTTIIRRVSINRYNEINRQKRVPSALTLSLDEIGAFVSDTSLEGEEEAQRLGRVISDYLRTLTKRQRYIFMSRYYMAEPIERVASELSVSTSTVNKEIACIKEGLKEALRKEGYTV